MRDLTTHRSVHHLSLGDASRSNARRFASLEATVDGTDRWTYHELEQHAAAVAAGLRKRGAEPGDVVAWLGQNSAWMLAVLLAAARIGCCFAPISWRLTEQERQPLLDGMDPAVTLEDPEDAQALIDLSLDPQDQDLEDTSEDDPVLVIFTAAFEGRPLGAQLTHRGVITQALLLAARDRLDPSDTYLAAGPLSHIGTLQYVLAHWLVGARTVFLPKMESESFVDAVEREHATSAFLVPASIPDLVRAAEERHRDLRSLRTPALSGDPVLERWTELTSRPRGSGSIGTSTGYGQTELSGLVSSVALVEGPPQGNAGWPQHVAVVRIVRPGTLEEAALGEVGEIVVRGPLVMSGYRNVAMGERWAGGWHHTTDLGRYEGDGSLTFIGAAGNMIKSGGENVYPVEVETVLREHPLVSEACVVGIDDARWGQIVAVMVASAGGLDWVELEAWSRERLAGYKRPRRWLVVSELPRVGSGQVDRGQVEQQLQSVPA